MQTLNRTTTTTTTSYPLRVVQFGGGNFLRAFANWMIQTLNDKTDFNAGVAVVKPTERGDYQTFRKQEGLFFVVEDGLDKGQLIHRTKRVDCVQQIVHPYREYEQFLQLAEESSLRFVISNTTEAGIEFEEEKRPTTAPANTFPGKLTCLLHRRYQAFKGSADSGLIILPCELIEDNGKQLQRMVHRYIEHWKLEDEFAQWIDSANYFCNTLVDRIVPGFPEARAEELFEEIGFEDQLLVAAEPYHLWVIEAPEAVQQDFPVNQTDLNVIFTKDLDYYRTRKVRILNGAHTAMVPVGYLYGLRTVVRTIEDPVVGQFISDLIHGEIIPALAADEAAADDLEQYAEAILDRFRNPSIKHQLSSIALNSTTKFRTRLLPSLLDYVEKNRSVPQRIVFALAALTCFYKGEWQGSNTPLKDDEAHIAYFQRLWQQYADDYPGLAKGVLAYESLWQENLLAVKGLANLLASYLEHIHTEGMAQALQELF